MFVKGAPDRLMPMCCGQLRSDALADIDAASLADFAPLDLEFWRKAQEDLSSEGLRVLALCRGDLNPEEDADGLSPRGLLKRQPQLAMVALMAILDPPRDEAIEAVKVAHTAGITVKMITGGCVHGELHSSSLC
jgi:magnesium-transporting ATPase (P-type)